MDKLQMHYDQLKKMYIQKAISYMIPFPCVSGTVKIKGSKKPDQWLPVTTMRK